MLARLAHAVLQAMPPNIPIEPAAASTRTRRGGPYYIASRSVGRQIVLKRNPNYNGQAPRATSDTIVITINTDLGPEPAPGQGAAGRLRRWAGLPSAARGAARAATAASTRPVLRQPARRDRLRRTEHVPADVRQGRRSARRSTSRSTVRRCSASAARSPVSGRPDPAAGHARGYQRRQLLPDPGRRTSRRRRRLAGNKCGMIRLYTTTSARRSGARAGAAVQLQADRAATSTSSSSSGVQLYAKDGTKGEPFDAASRAGADYPDPYDFIEHPAERQQHPRRRTTTTSPTSTTRRSTGRWTAANRHRRRPLQGVRQARHPITKKYAPWAANVQPQRARLLLGADRSVLRLPADLRAPTWGRSASSRTAVVARGWSAGLEAPARRPARIADVDPAPAQGTDRHDPLHHPAHPLGERALHRGHGRHVRHLLHHPGRPGEARRRQGRDAGRRRARRALPRHSTGRSTSQYWQLPRSSWSGDRLARLLVRQPAERQHDRLAARARSPPRSSSAARSSGC